MLESDAFGDDRLLRGEIMTITDIMAARLRTKSLRPHIVAPVRNILSLVGISYKLAHLAFGLDPGGVSHGSPTCPRAGSGLRWEDSEHSRV